MKQLIYILLVLINLSAHASEPSLRDLYHTHNSSADLVGFITGPSVKKRIELGDADFRIREYASGCKLALLDPADNFKTKKFKNLPHWQGTNEIKLLKAKVLSCKAASRMEGKEIFFSANVNMDSSKSEKSYLWNSHHYKKRSNRIIQNLLKEGAQESLQKLAADFAETPIGVSARESYELVVKARQQRQDNIKSERDGYIREINTLYHDSFNNIDKLITLTKKYKNDEIYRKGSIDDMPIKFSDAITQQEYDEMVKFAYNHFSKFNNIDSHKQFIEHFPSHKLKGEAIKSIYELVKSQNNIIAYDWFISSYPSVTFSTEALMKMHSLAFELVDDIDTINAYNDFVIAYPTAKQVREANDRAYELEKSEYVGILSYFSEEKDARRLLVQSKILEQSAEDLSSDEKAGYMMVVNRMNDLLKQEFNSTDAALRHLESNEFKSFVRTFKRSMKDLKRQVRLIADNTADLSSIMKNQSSLMNNHFENAAQDREMASELTKQHRNWERFIGEVGL
ncbi:hypothetical protein ACOYR1_17445 [Thalassotalea piscium]